MIFMYKKGNILTTVSKGSTTLNRHCYERQFIEIWLPLTGPFEVITLMAVKNTSVKNKSFIAGRNTLTRHCILRGFIVMHNRI